jgi:hypothetical protein
MTVSDGQIVLLAPPKAADDLLTAVRTEARVHHFDQVILATSRWLCTWLSVLCGRSRLTGCGYALDDG